ncbi:MAG: YIP1 family protein [Deltaproteobacteria bacterium]|nr:YIP1 family protein [Deltaproteobacteria bacterium]
MGTLIDRMIRASKLDAGVYEEVEKDPSTMGQAVMVVVISSVAAGIGSMAVTGFSGLVVGTLVALAGWFLWSFLTYIIGTKMLPEPQTKADYGELLRTIGFSSAPGVIRVLAFIPVVGLLINFLAGIWMLVAMVIAVRQALDYQSTGRAVGVCLIGWVVQFLFFIIIFGIFGSGQPA